MLASGQRLRRSTDFTAVVRGGRRCGSAVLVVHLLTGPEALGPARCGFVVGRAVGDSVTRHRVTRRLRHLVRSRMSTLAPGTRLVVRALAPAATASSVELDTALARCLTRVLP